MFIYNVTVKVEAEAISDWLQWMKQQHIQEVLNTKCFFDAKIFRLHLQDDSGSQTYVTQYFCHEKIDYLKYQKKFAADLQKDATEKFGLYTSAFRSFMELI